MSAKESWKKIFEKPVKSSPWTTLCDSVQYLAYKEPTCYKKIASFDFDHTLVKTKSGNTFAKHSADWMPWSDNVPQMLRDLHNDNYSIVIFSNQNGIMKETDQKKKQSFEARMQSFLNQLDVPVHVFASTKDDYYRKPCLGMWDLCCEKISDVDTKNSFYVGDAAGRPEHFKKGAKKDFSDTDRKFALNAEITFYTPDEFFLKEPAAPFALRGFNPRTYSTANVDVKVTRRDGKEMIIFVGWPASSKSTFAQNYFSDYEIINQDKLKSIDKCIKAAVTAMLKEKSLVIDNTNLSLKSRKLFIDKANDNCYPIRCIYFNVDREQSWHLNVLRSLTEERSLVPKVAYHKLAKEFQEPSLDEGFIEIQKVDFVFNSASDKKIKLFYQFLY